MSLNATGENIKVFAHDFNGRTSYSLAISAKKYANGQKTDDYITAFMYAQFPRNNAPNDRDKIDITKGFFAPYENRNGDTGFKLIVQEWQNHGQNYDSGYNWG